MATLNTQLPIGELKSKKIVYCSICTLSYLRKASVLIYDRNEIESAKLEITKKINADYTCKICKSNLKALNK